MDLCQFNNKNALFTTHTDKFDDKCQAFKLCNKSCTIMLETVIVLCYYVWE